MINLINALKAINYWETDPGFNFGFIRENYMDEIIRSSGNKLIKVVVGQRRTGKSYIIRQYIRYLINDKSIDPKNIFYLNLELFDFDEIKTANDLAGLINQYKQEVKPQGKGYIFIDEIQNIDEWEKVVVSLAQHPVEDFELYITGSNSRLLSGELASLLSGRYLLMEVFPFSYIEFLRFQDHQNSKDNFVRYIQTSGLPEIYNFHSGDIQRHYFQSLKDTILLKDIMYRHKIRDYVLLEDLFLFLLHNVGNLISVPAIVKYFKSKQRKADYATVSAYIEYMEEAFIVRSCQRYAIKTKELLSGEKKYYVNDLGFRNFLYPQLMTDFAAMLENVVYLHLRMAGFEVTVGNEKNLEIDFVATRGEHKMYIQVAYLLSTEQTISREYRALESIDDNYPKYVVSMDELKMIHHKGIIHQNIWEFISFPSLMFQPSSRET